MGGRSGSMNARRAVSALLVGAAVLGPSTAARSQQPAPGLSASAPAAPGGEASLSSPELEAMLAPLAAERVDDRRAAAGALASLGGGATAALGKKMADVRKAGDGGTYSAVKAAKERAGGGGFDLLEALVIQKPEASVTRALTTVCLVRALAHAATTPAVRQLVLAASDAGGVLRPELGRQLKQLGDRAAAGLIEARADPSPETRTWAAALLDALGKRAPGDAVQTKDNQALSDVLRAYATIKDLDALPVVLSFVNSDRAQVRAAAREATLAYGKDALWKLREAYAALSGDPAPDGMSSADLAKKLFDAYDRFRLHDVYALLDRGLAEQREGHLREAVSSFDEALARQPLLDRRAEAAPAYMAFGKSLEDSDRPLALAYLRRALRLDESGPRSSDVRSEVLALEGEDLMAHGISDTEPFETGLALDPSNARARAALDRIHGQLDAGRAQTWRLGAAAGVLALALAGITALAGHRKRAVAGPNE